MNGSCNLETSYRLSPLLSYIQDSVVSHMHICARITEAGFAVSPHGHLAGLLRSRESLPLLLTLPTLVELKHFSLFIS